MDRYEPRNVLLYAFQDGKSIAGPVVVGDDNNGGLAVDSNNIVHLTWRNFSVYYNTYSITKGAGTSTVLHPSSDFSWCSVSPLDGSIHVVNTVRNGGGIHYRFMREGKWSDVITLAQAKVMGVDDSDNVGPTIASDVNGT